MHNNYTSWVQCSKRQPCPACGKDHHCTISTNGLMSKCMYLPGGRELKQTDGKVAYLRRVSECGDGAAKIKPSKPRPAAQKMKTREVELLIKQSRSALSPRRLKQAAESLGVSERSLKLLLMGWDDAWQCFTFPMFDGSRKPVGIRLRRPNPKPDEQRYLCIPGSTNGLFIPDNYDPTPCPVTLDPSPSVVVMPEGPTDVAAALDLGLMAIGRFSNCGGQRDIYTLLSESKTPIDLVLMADRDGVKFLPDGTPYSPGWEGALAIAGAVFGHKNVSWLRVVFPPDGAKDLREWFKNGGRAEAIAYAAAGGEQVTREWLRHKRNAMNRVKLETQTNIKARKIDPRQDREGAMAALADAKRKLLAKSVA